MPRCGQMVGNSGDSHELHASISRTDYTSRRRAKIGRIIYWGFGCNHSKDTQVAVPDQQQPEEEQRGLAEALKCAPVWQEEIDRVLELARCIEQRALERGLSRGILSQTFLSGLHCLVRALLQQKRHLLEPIPESSNYEVKVVYGCTICNPEGQQL